MPFSPVFRASHLFCFASSSSCMDMHVSRTTPDWPLARRSHCGETRGQPTQQRSGKRYSAVANKQQYGRPHRLTVLPAGQCPANREASQVRCICLQGFTCKVDQPSCGRSDQPDLNIGIQTYLKYNLPDGADQESCLKREPGNLGKMEPGPETSGGWGSAGQPHSQPRQPGLGMPPQPGQWAPTAGRSG